jgi:hypothetical protein
MVSPLYLAVWLLCGLGAAVFAAAFPQSWYTRAAVLLGFIATSLWTNLAGVPAAADIGTLAAVMSILVLAERSSPLFSGLSGGALASILSAHLQLQKVPEEAAWPLSVAVLLAALILAAVHEGFTPERMHEEALLGIGTLGILIAAIPELAAGWQSALGLNVSEKTAENVTTIPTWALLSVGVSCSAGAAWTLFRSRRTYARRFQ